MAFFLQSWPLSNEIETIYKQQSVQHIIRMYTRLVRKCVCEIRKTRFGAVQENHCTVASQDRSCNTAFGSTRGVVVHFHSLHIY